MQSLIVMFIQDAQEYNKIFDTQPLNITEVRAWNLRPRSKDLELGPDVRHNAKIQMERIYDHITAKISPYFTDKALTKEEVHNQIKSFSKTGKRQHQGFYSTGGFSSTAFSFKPGSEGVAIRDSRLGNNLCVLQPQTVMYDLHKKSHFKGV